MQTFALDQIKGESNKKRFLFFWATFDSKSKFDFILATFEQLFEKSRATCGKPDDVPLPTALRHIILVPRFGCLWLVEANCLTSQSDGTSQIWVYWRVNSMEFLPALVPQTFIFRGKRKRKISRIPESGLPNIERCLSCLLTFKTTHLYSHFHPLRILFCIGIYMILLGWSIVYQLQHTGSFFSRIRLYLSTVKAISLGRWALLSKNLIYLR